MNRSQEMSQYLSSAVQIQPCSTISCKVNDTDYTDKTEKNSTRNTLGITKQMYCTNASDLIYNAISGRELNAVTINIEILGNILISIRFFWNEQNAATS